MGCIQSTTSTVSDSKGSLSAGERAPLLGGTAVTQQAASSSKPLGISLPGLLAFVKAHGGRYKFRGRSTAWVKLNVLKPATFSSQASYVAPLAAAGSPHVAPATAFLSHAYDDEFLGVVDAVAALEAREPASAGSFYYFDLLVVNQGRRWSF